jgi:hypothetical protein
MSKQAEPLKHSQLIVAEVMYESGKGDYADVSSTVEQAIEKAKHLRARPPRGFVRARAQTWDTYTSSIVRDHWSYVRGAELPAEPEGSNVKATYKVTVFPKKRRPVQFEVVDRKGASAVADLLVRKGTLSPPVENYMKTGVIIERSMLAAILDPGPRVERIEISMSVTTTHFETPSIQRRTSTGPEIQ